MASLNLDNFPNQLLEKITQLAAANNCSIEQQTISMLNKALNLQNGSHQTQTSKSIIHILEASRHRREQLPPSQMSSINRQMA